MEDTPPDTAHALMLGSLTQYFSRHAAHRRMLHELVEGRTAISLRMLDWFVTHYAKRHNTLYWIDGDALHTQYPGTGNNPAAPPKKFAVYIEYRSQLRAFSKHVFDPFRRHHRISFVVGERPDETPIFVDTTIGQLNFFRWALQNKVIDYVLSNLPQIEEEASSFQQQRRKQKNPDECSEQAPARAAIAAPPPTRVLFN
jgi:hypothetical protein